MKSPFPGMDPYLERHWHAVHTALVAHASDELNRVLPADLVARAEERLAIGSEDPAISRYIRPDVVAFAPGVSDVSEGGIAVEAPYKLVVDLDPITERFIKIIGASDERLITVIEFVSPTNKIGKGLEKYLDKRDTLLRSGVHVIEVDLVRRGDWRELILPHSCPREALAPYRATVRIGGLQGIAYLYPMPLRHALPAVSVPLRAGDPSVRLELQPLIQEIYRAGRYAQTLDYSIAPPSPPLDPEDAAWAGELLKAAGKR